MVSSDKSPQIMNYDSIKEQDDRFEASTPLTRLLMLAGQKNADMTIDDELLKIRGQYMNYQDYLAATKALIKRLGTEDCGYQVGRSFEFSNLGVLGHAMISSATLKEAIETYMMYRDAFGAVFPLTLKADGKLVSIEADIKSDDPQISRYLAENWITAFSKLAELVSDPYGLPFAAVHFAIKQPDYYQEYEALFQCEVHFEQPVTAMILYQEAMEYPLKYRNFGVHRLCVNECEFARRMLQHNDNLSHFVKAKCYQAYGTFPTIASLSKTMGLSERTLRRRLTAQGLSFQKMILDAKMKRALNYLQNQLPIKEIAHILGYGDVQSLHRSFKDYYGVAPGQYETLTEIKQK